MPNATEYRFGYLHMKTLYVALSTSLQQVSDASRAAYWAYNAYRSNSSMQRQYVKVV